MYAKFKFTQYMADQISDLRKKILGYSHECFGRDILGSSQTKSYYLCDTVRRETIDVDLIREIYLIKYNAYLFVRKQHIMSQMLQLGIETGTILPKIKDDDKYIKTSLEAIYGTKNTLSSDFNPSQICIPKEIFTKQKCILPEKCIKSAISGGSITTSIMETFFDENNFPEELRYVPTKYNLLNDSERIRCDKFIIVQIENSLKNCNISMLRSEYWLYGMYLMHKTCNISVPMQQYISRMYFDNEDRIDWGAIFKKLQKNEYVKRLYQYECDLVYFKDEDAVISKDDFPLFVYKYNDDITDEYEKRINMANMSDIKLIDLFMAIYNYNMSIGKSESAAFKLTCTKLHSYSIYIPFNDTRLDLYPLLYDPSLDLTATTTVKFHSMIKEFFRTAELDEEKDIDIIRFNNNHMRDPFRFMRAISFDFDFVQKLNNEMASELRDELQKTAQEFKRANKLK